MALDLSFIDTQKTLEKVIDSKQPIKESLSQLINILDKFDCKSKLAEIEKQICDYIDDHKKSKEMIKEINKPKVFMEDGKLIEFKYGDIILTISHPEIFNDDKNVFIYAIEYSLGHRYLGRNKYIKKLVYDILVEYFPNIKLKYIRNRDNFQSDLYTFSIEDKKTIESMVLNKNNTYMCSYINNNKRCELDKIHDNSNYCDKHSIPEKFHEDTGTDTYDNENDDDILELYESSL